MLFDPDAALVRGRVIAEARNVIRIVGITMSADFEGAKGTRGTGSTA